MIIPPNSAKRTNARVTCLLYQNKCSLSIENTGFCGILRQITKFCSFFLHCSSIYAQQIGTEIRPTSHLHPTNRFWQCFATPNIYSLLFIIYSLKQKKTPQGLFSLFNCVRMRQRQVLQELGKRHLSPCQPGRLRCRTHQFR